LVTAILDKTTTVYSVQCYNYSIDKKVATCKVGASLVLPDGATVLNAWPLKSKRAYKEDEGYFWFINKVDQDEKEGIHIVHFSFDSMDDSLFKPETKTFNPIHMHYTLSGPTYSNATFIITNADKNEVVLLRTDTLEPVLPDVWPAPVYSINNVSTVGLVGKPFCPIEVGNCPKNDQFIEILSVCGGQDARIVEYSFSADGTARHAKDVLMNHP
jgi:hypothetical protein